MLGFSVTAAPSPTYWPSHYSYSGLNTSYDPYLSPHYDYSQYYPATTQDTLIDTPDTVTSTNTTEDITFAEAFTALANFEPNLVTEERPETSTSSPPSVTSTDVNAKQPGSFDHQHLQTFNEINSGRAKADSLRRISKNLFVSGGFSYYLQPPGGAYHDQPGISRDHAG